jgi:hypothetical protein
VYDVLNADCMVFTQPALAATTSWLSATKAARPAKEAK